MLNQWESSSKASRCGSFGASRGRGGMRLLVLLEEGWNEAPASLVIVHKSMASSHGQTKQKNVGQDQKQKGGCPLVESYICEQYCRATNYSAVNKS